MNRFVKKCLILCLIVILGGVAAFSASSKPSKKMAVCWVSSYLNKVLSKKAAGYWFSLVECYRLDKVSYSLQKAPIDVIIPCTSKDKLTLDLCLRVS